MGLVFKARHVFLKTLHAIKIILPDLVGNDPNLATRFRQEALAAAAIRHQNIISVTDFGITADSMPFLVMEFVQGKSLQEIMADEGAMPLWRAMELMEPICAGMAAAHRQKIIHRDLKPLNVMIQDGMPLNEGIKILDFGLAKIKSGELLGSFVAAQTTGLLGSPSYMAPEQWSDEGLDARADIYSLGIMFYQMLCGEVPFKGGSIPAIMKKHLTEPVPSLASKGVAVAPSIENAIRHALEKDPQHRTASTEDLISELRASTVVDSSAFKGTTESPASERSEHLPTVQAAPTGEGRETVPLSRSTAVVEDAKLSREQEQAKVAQEKLTREAETNRRRAEEQRQRKVEAAPDHGLEKSLETTDRKQAKVLDNQVPPVSPGVSQRSALLDSEETKARTGIGLATAGIDPFSQTRAQSFSQIEASSRQTRKTALILGLALSSVLLMGVSFGGLYFLRSKLLQTTSKEAPIKPNLIEIPGGTFQMGRNNSAPAERPAHSVTVPSFFMDKTEVTNSEYQQFVRDTNHAPPAHWGGVNPPEGSQLLPVSNVAYEDAIAFAAWRSQRDGLTYRLPTEEEWEYAARNGEKGDMYPWGNVWTAGLANTEESGVSAAQAVGTYPGGSNTWGVQDLIGNVWEWTCSKYSLYAGNPNQPNPEYKDQRVIRGGGYASSRTGTLQVSGTMREWVTPDYLNPLLGFRLVRSAHP